MFFTIVGAWFLIIGVLRTRELTKIPFNSEVITFFDNNRLIDIYYAAARSNKEALIENRKVSDHKMRLLKRGYSLMICAVVLLMVFLFIFTASRTQKAIIN